MLTNEHQAVCFKSLNSAINFTQMNDFLLSKLHTSASLWLTFEASSQ